MGQQRSPDFRHHTRKELEQVQRREAGGFYARAETSRRTKSG